MHQFACSSILEVRFEKLPMIRNKSITQIKHISYSLSQFLTCERDFIRLLAFLVELFVECVSLVEIDRILGNAGKSHTKIYLSNRPTSLICM